MKYGWYCRDFRQFPESSLHHVWSHTQRILAGGGASSYWEGKPLVCHLDQHQWFKFALLSAFFCSYFDVFRVHTIDSLDTLSSSRANQGRKFQRGKRYKPKKEFAYRMCARATAWLLRDVMSRHFMSCHVIWCHLMWCDFFMWFAVMWWAVICCEVMWCNGMGFYESVMRCGWLWGDVVWFEEGVWCGELEDGVVILTTKY